MGFQITAPTDLPANPDGTLDSWTWGESGGPFAVPADEDPGLGNVTLPADTLNYEFQHGGRWSRAMRDRMAMSDEGLLASCILRQGAWNIGGGTLGVTLAPTRLVVDVDGDGGTVIEVTAPVGNPETLTANRDTYVDFDESGGYTLAAVPNGDPEPPLTPGHVRVYELVTDATELVSAGLAQGVAPFVCFGPIVGAVEFAATDLSVVNTLQVGGLSTFSDDATFSAEITVEGPVTLNSDATINGTLDVNGSATFSAPVSTHTHATAAGWQDAFRPTSRTFTTSGLTDGGGVGVASFTITGVGDAFFPKTAAGGATSAAVGFEFFLTVVVGANGSGASPTVASLNTTAARRFDAIATLNGGSYTTVTPGTVTGPVDGTAPTITATISGGDVLVTCTFATPANAPYRVLLHATQHRCAILGP